MRAVADAFQGLASAIEEAFAAAKAPFVERAIGQTTP
jgi:hypothetical protein